MFFPRRLLSVTLLASCALASQLFSLVPAQAETLEGAVSAALNYHPQVETAQAGLEAALYGEEAQRSGYFPELSFSATGGRVFGDNSTSRGLSVSRGTGYSYLWEGSGTLRQPLFDGFETTNRVESAHAKKEAAEMDLASVREDLALRAAQSYTNVMRVRAALALLHRHEEKVGAYLKRIKTALEDGAADDAEYQKARDVQALLEGIIADYEGQAQAADAEYLQLTGHLPEGALMQPPLYSDSLPETPEEAVSKALESHPALQAAARNAESLSYDVSAEEARLYPALDGELSYLKSDKADIIGGELVDARAVVRMSWNFETGGAQLARIKGSKQEYREALSRRQEAQRRVSQQVRLAFARYETALKQFEIQEKRRALNAQLLETYKVQFEGARVRVLDLMQAENQLFNTELDKLNSKYRALGAHYGVLAGMGLLQDTITADHRGTLPAQEEARMSEPVSAPVSAPVYGPQIEEAMLEETALEAVQGEGGAR
ncbi:MAG: TolC family protein [Alphaproteobacteria bacterium]